MIRAPSIDLLVLYLRNFDSNVRNILVFDSPVTPSLTFFRLFRMRDQQLQFGHIQVSRKSSHVLEDANGTQRRGE